MKIGNIFHMIGNEIADMRNYHNHICDVCKRKIEDDEYYVSETSFKMVHKACLNGEVTTVKIRDDMK